MKSFTTLFLLVISMTLQAQKSVLAIGANPKILAPLAAELQVRGYTVETCNDYDNPALIKQRFEGKKFDVIAFGRALTVESKADLKTFFKSQNLTVEFVEGMAPITHLLADQVELAGNHAPQHIELNQPGKKMLELTVEKASSLKITFYQLNWMYRQVEKVLYEGTHTGGILRVELPKKSGQRFVTVRLNGQIEKVIALQ